MSVLAGNSWVITAYRGRFVFASVALVSTRGGTSKPGDRENRLQSLQSWSWHSLALEEAPQNLKTGRLQISKDFKTWRRYSNRKKENFTTTKYHTVFLKTNSGNILINHIRLCLNMTESRNRTQ